jgi:hypothetical protein
MPSIVDRLGSQNVVRVLSSSGGSSGGGSGSNLLYLDDVNNDLQNQDGMILVWDLPTQQFIMTSVVDSSTSAFEGIIFFQNETDNTLGDVDTGAVQVDGGVGIAKNLTVGLGLSVTGFATFESDVFFNNDIIVGAGLSVGELLKVLDTTDNVLGDPDTGALQVDGGVGINKNVTIGAGLSVANYLYYPNDKFDGPNGIAYFDNLGRLIGAASTENAVQTSFFVLTTDTVGIPTWTSVIDGGIY